MNSPPLVSIGLPIYNGERFLEQALDSLLSQTFTDFEIIISDNCSDDRSRDICERYAKEHSCIRYLRQRVNLGAARNYNITFEQARGRYFKWMAHDDIIAPTYLERCLHALEANGSNAVLAFAKMRIIDEHGETSRDYDDPMTWDGSTPASRLGSLIWEPLSHSYAHRCHPVVGLIRSDQLRKTRLIGRYNSSDKVALAELSLLGDFIEIPEYLFLRRVHKETSLNANTTARDVARWFDPNARHLFVAPYSRLFFEYLRSVLRSDIAVGEKLRCARVMMRIFKRDWRIIGGETRNALVDAVRLLVQGRQTGAGRRDE